jgi:hypothetical protein
VTNSARAIRGFAAILAGHWLRRTRSCGELGYVGGTEGMIINVAIPLAGNR